MTSSPMISIITPVKGRTGLFSQTYASVMNQTVLDWEWIIIDDGSTESEYCEIEKLCNSDDRVSFTKRDNKGCGASYCRNVGADKATGEWLVFLDADDLLAAEFVENRINDIKSNSDLDFIAYRTLVFHEHPFDTDILWNDFTDEDDLDRFLKVDTPWQTTGVVWNKKFFSRIGGFDAECKNWQDWEIHVRALTENPRYIKVVRDIDFFYRKSNWSDISTKNASKDFLLDRIETVDKLIPMLKKSNMLTSRRRYFIAKLLFSINSLLCKEYAIGDAGVQIIKKYSLVGSFELSVWQWYIRKNYNEIAGLSLVGRIIKKITDKIIYLCRHDHFLETKTNFLSVRYKQ